MAEEVTDTQVVDDVAKVSEDATEVTNDLNDSVQTTESAKDQFVGLINQLGEADTDVKRLSLGRQMYRLFDEASKEAKENADKVAALNDQITELNGQLRDEVVRNLDIQPAQLEPEKEQVNPFIGLTE